MNNKELIINATISLINEKGNNLEEITIREISKRSGVGLGLINYHFKNKENLIKICVEKIVNGIIEEFRNIDEKTKGFTAFEKLDYLGNMTFSFLFEHRAISKISMLSDDRFPQKTDNTQLTVQAYIPLIAKCHPEWENDKVQQMTFCLISTMQAAFLRHEVIRELYGIDLKDSNIRKEFHTKMLENIIGRAKEGKYE